MLRSLVKEHLFRLWILLTILVLNPAGIAQALTLHAVDDSHANFGAKDSTHGGSSALKVNGQYNTYLCQVRCRSPGGYQ